MRYTASASDVGVMSSCTTHGLKKKSRNFLDFALMYKGLSSLAIFFLDRKRIYKAKKDKNIK